MILFPNAKINLGLRITSRRPDGYHNINTVMVPVGWHDILEITPVKGQENTLHIYGRRVDCPPEKNLVMKAFNALNSFTGGLPHVAFNLEKVIPDGAGLGGGSADAAFALKGLNDLFNLGLSFDELASVAVRVGADCPFFIYNTPAICRGIGDEINFDVSPCLKGKAILIVKPHVAAVSTKEAYDGIVPNPHEVDLASIVSGNLDEWKYILKNDFETSIFEKLPILLDCKNKMYREGAEYASMTGSGAAIFGVFENDNLAHRAYENFSGCDKFVTHVLGLND